MRIAIAALLKCAAESDDPIKSSFGGGVGGTWEVCTDRSVGELSKVSVLRAFIRLRETTQRAGRLDRVCHSDLRET